MKYYVLLIAALLMLPGCSSSGKLNETQNQMALLDYNITLSKGGGFTGVHQGFFIDSTGKVSSFEGIITTNVKNIYKGSLSSEQINEINNLSAGVVKINYNQNGNMTSSISLKNKFNEFNFSWPGVAPDKNVPAELVQFYEKLSNIINHLKE